MKSTNKTARIVRRSVALPRALVEAVNSVAPAPLRKNFNRLVTAALGQVAEAQPAAAFERAIREMAGDPENPARMPRDRG